MRKLPQEQRKQTITVSLPPTLIKALDAMRDRTKTPRSTIIETMIRANLETKRAA